ncbi:MAG: PIN domain-containing protein [Candidatus Cyclonatronum sp.]|uniref:PIN domain-containing protein n=1 Tax=Cyclonatronum sp. TaxID=3024185 RepID=UPI0025C220E8|nr:PIN domain-containing protein [Cyclonatronum sp.]MCH8487581.1 PIN domain-containing protein [Cyclonatronum sp.]
MRKTVILDACVLYSAPLRDFLLHLAQQKLYKPRWSDRINDEWIRNVLKNRSDLSEYSFYRLRLLMDEAFPNANVKDYDQFMEGLSLPDQGDIHVLAAAIKAKADFIVTFNIKDFPYRELIKHGLKSLHPDEFLTSLIKGSPVTATQAFLNQVEHLNKPPIPATELLDIFRNSNIQNSANLLENLL